MKKILLALLFIPSMFLTDVKKPVKNDVFVEKNALFSIVLTNNIEHPFLDCWAIFREENTDVCDVTKDEFVEIYNVYLSLTSEEKEFINASPDNPEIPEGYTIGQVIRTIVNRLYPNQNKMREERQKLDQSSIIIIASVVALVGATAISVLYILKNNKIIK